MKNRFLRHPGLAAASLVLAFFIWLIILNINDPIVSRVISDVPVTVTNASYVESMGLSYKIADGFDKISVKVRGNRSVVEPLAAGDIMAVADLTQIVDFSSVPVMVPVNVSIKGLTADAITATPSNIQIELEQMVSKDFVLTPTAGETKPENGFQVGKMAVSPETLTLHGPGSVIDKIDRITAAVDVTNLSSDSDLKPVIKVIDKNGEELSDTEMSYLTFNVDRSTISVHVTLYSVVTDVAVSVETYGTPEKGYQVGTIAATPSTLSVVGSSDALKALADSGNKLTITADSAAVDLTGAMKDFDVKVDISSFLPDGITLAEDVSSTVVVSVQILPYNSKSFSVETKKITVSGLSQGFNCVFALDKIEVKVSGSDAKLQALTADAIKASVNLSGLQVGSQKVPVSIALPDGYELADNVTCDVTISQQTFTAASSALPAA